MKTTTVAGTPTDLYGKDLAITIPLTAEDVATGCDMGLKTDANGRVIEKTRKFSTADRVYVSIGLRQAPADLFVSVRVFDTNDKQVAMARKPAGSQTSVTLDLAPLPAGKYRLGTYWGGNEVCEGEIEVTKH